MVSVILGFPLFVLCIIATFFSIVNLLTALAGFRQAKEYPAYHPKVSVIVRTWNDHAVIERCIRNLMEQNYPSDKFEIIIADDSTDDKTEKICENYKNDIRYFRLEHKELKAEIVDEIIRKHAVGEVIVEKDVDGVAKADWLTEIVKPLQDKNIAGATGPVFSGNWSSVIAACRTIENFWHFCCGAIGRYNITNEAALYGSNKAYKKSYWKEVGGHPTKTMVEDAEISMKFMEAGYKIAFAKKAVMMQEEVETLKQYMSERKRWTSGDFAAFKLYKDVLKKNLLNYFIIMANFSMDAWFFFSWAFIWFQPLFAIPLVFSLAAILIGLAEYRAKAGFYLFACIYTVINPLLQTIGILGVLKDRYFGSGVKWTKVFHYPVELKWPVKKI